MHYLDTAATTPLAPAVLDAMAPYLAPDRAGGGSGVLGNPSSRHEPGIRAARAIAEARERIAAHLSCRASEIVVTSGGTEADNLAIKGIALATPRGRHLVTTPVEHDAVLASVDFLQRIHGFEATLVPVDRDGLVDPDEFAAALRPDTTLASVQHANNEVGTIQPVARLAAIARAAGAPFHTDAVQSAGWLDVGLGSLGVDALSISAHKLGGPAGVGVLAVRSGIALEPLVHGGGQERGRRSGTENVAGIVGLATALDLAESARRGPGSGVSAAGSVGELARARDSLVGAVLSGVPGAFLTGSRTDRLPNHASFCFPGVAGETVLLELESRGVVCSSGSACAAGRDEPSHVLIAMGIDPDVALSAVRMTLPVGFDVENAREVGSAVVDAVAAVRAIG